MYARDAIGRNMQMLPACIQAGYLPSTTFHADIHKDANHAQPRAAGILMRFFFPLATGMSEATSSLTECILSGIDENLNISATTIKGRAENEVGYS
jgi:hypothetical protein